MRLTRRRGFAPVLTLLVAPAISVAVAVAVPAHADEGGTLPDNTYAPDKLRKIISPPMGAVKHNQPSIVNGYLMLAGNAKHELWDIHTPTVPKLISLFESPHAAKEAESHQVSFGRRGDTHFAVTISGKGIDFWDLTDAKKPLHLSTMLLEGIDYGDNTNAVWGVAWQGKFVWVGGTNTGLHVVDASDPAAPKLVTRIPTSQFGGVSAGPLFALGNLLVITTPKENAGIATLDIGDPENPAPLAFVLPEEKSYIGGFYGGNLHLLTPFRTYDVTTDPTNITLLGTTPSPKSEYMSFGDGYMFVGGLRPKPGIFKFDISDPGKPVELAKIDGRTDKLGGAFTDDQFPLPVGNLLVMSDDEVSIGSVIAVHDTQRDSKPPSVLYVNPKDGATSQPPTTRVGLSFSDQIDLRSVDGSSIVVRPLGGATLAGTWGHTQTLVSFWPDAPLAPNTTYEILVPKDGVKDLAGNPITQDFSSVFSTGSEVKAPKCLIAGTSPTLVGTPAALAADGAPTGATFHWNFGDGESSATLTDAATTHTYAAPGRYPLTLTVKLDGASRTCTALQIAHRPLAATPPTHSSTIVYDEAAKRVWVVNPDDDSVVAVDEDTLTVVARADVGDHPRTLARAPDGTIWVSCQDSDEIVVLEEDGSRAASIALPWGSSPFGIAFSPDGNAAWVALEGKGALADIDPVSRTIRRTVELGPDARRVRSLALTADRAFVTRFLSPTDHGEVYEVSTKDGTVVRTIALAADPGPDETTKGRGIPNTLGALAVSPDGVRAFVPAKKDNTLRGLARDGEALNTDNTVRTIVSFIDLASGTEDTALRRDLDNHDMASAIATSPVGDLVFVASQGTNHVDVLDAYSGKLVAGFATGQAPQGLALSPGGKLFVQAFLSRTVDVYDVAKIVAGTDAAASRVGSVITVAKEALSPDVLLGKQIFYNAADPRMSLDGYLSCATCHPDGGQDARVWDFTDRGEGLRNTTSLMGRAGMGHGPVHWTGNFDEIQDFENDMRLHFGGGGFLTDAEFVAEGRQDTLGTPKAGVNAALDALAAFVATLDRFPRSRHRNPDGSLTAEAEQGRDIVMKLDCTGCHTGQTLTDSAPGKLHDVGTLKATSGKRLGKTLTGLDTPTLRGLWETGPYLHDGSAATLAEVLDNPLHGNASVLSRADKDSIVQFLLQLENEELDLPEPVTGDAAVDGGCGCRVGSGESSAPRVSGLVLALLAWFARRRRRAA